MKTEPLASARSRFEERGDGVRVVIPARRRVFPTLFLPLWLVGWFFGERAVLHTLFGAGRGDGLPSVFLLVWLVGWTFGGGFAAFSLLWTLFGGEVVTLNGQFLTVRWEVLGVGRERRFDLAQVKDLRCSPLAENARSRSAPWAGGLVAFDYGAKTMRFGQDLDEAEAKLIVQRLADRNPWRR
jgi:hypothetical protein